MKNNRSPRRELLEIWSKNDRGKGTVLFPPDLSKEGGPPAHLFKAYKRLWLDHMGNSLYLDSILKKGWEKTPRPWRRLLALAFSELQWSPEKDLHGVVHDWAELARSNLGEKVVKVINGTLRTACRQLQEGKAPSNGLPDNLKRLLENKDSRTLLDQPLPLFGFTPNSENQNKVQDDTEILEHEKLGQIHILKPGTSPGAWAKEMGGFIQNLSAAEVSAEVRARFRGKNLLDYCAAPGGKTWQLLRLGLSEITFHDHSPRRLEMMKTSQASSTFKTRAQVLEDFDTEFDGILIDLPCSNSGVLNKCPEAVRHYWAPTTSFADLQEEVFVAALNLLRHGGQLFYSTCSIDPTENEHRVESLASRFGLQLIFQRKWQPDEEGRHGAYFAELLNCE